MGITMFTYGSLLGPLHSLVGWFAQRARRCAPEPQARQSARGPRPVVPARPCDKARRPLRVVRVVESAGAPASAGRMFMSGRMADVCAELDRLAALEAG